jgi:glycosyltransferase involved in cell wall biosynthesis
MKGFSVLMPTYNQAAFIQRALKSLFAQTFKEWELILINDGCTDRTEDDLGHYLRLPNVRYIKNEHNRGLGYSLNRGLDMARYDYIAYLPSDDYYLPDHLATLFEQFSLSPEVGLVYTKAYSRIKDSVFNTVNTEVNGLFWGNGLQLVQTAHRQSDRRWLERREGVTSDLYRSFWSRLTDLGVFRFVDKETCGWSIQPEQRHKIMEDKYGGGYNIYRRYYDVREPLRYIWDYDKVVDEYELYEDFRKPAISSETGLKIVLVGDLCYFAERICAIEDQGHKLYGLWVERVPFGGFMVGPLPFGHVTNLSDKDWEAEIETIKPDLIYGLMSTPSIEIAHRVRKRFPSIPFVWHFKEGPSFCLSRDKKRWDKLIDLYRSADGAIFLHEEAKMFYECFMPEDRNERPVLLFDGEYAPLHYFTDDFSPKLSSVDGEPHTVVIGRDIGLEPEDVLEIVSNKVHVHYHCHISNFYMQRKLVQLQKSYPDYVHVHPFINSKDWVRVFSQYDAGWLHQFRSYNNGLPFNVGWDDLNPPARIGPLVASGLPLIMRNNRGHAVAMQSMAEKREIGIFYDTYEDLAAQLYDHAGLKRLGDQVMKQRESFSFDYHVPRLISFFKEVVEHKRSSTAKILNRL